LNIQPFLLWLCKEHVTYCLRVARLSNGNNKIKGPVTFYRDPEYFLVGYVCSKLFLQHSI